MQSPYEENIKIIKGFFRKPIILVYAIVSVLPLIAALFINFTSIFEGMAGSFGTLLEDVNASSTYYSMLFAPAFQLAFGVAFFYLFIHSRNDEKQLGMPTKLFRVLSMIWLILAALASLVLILALSLAVLYSLERFGIGENILILPAITAAVPALLLTAIGQAAFAGAVRNSVSSIYLSRRGVSFYGIMSIISALLDCYLIIALILGTTYMPEINGALVPMYLFVGANLIRDALSAVVALSYSSYIRKISQDFTTVPEAETESEDDEQLPYIGVQGVTAQQTEVITCKKCGKQLTPDDYFCNHCGTPVEK